MASWRDTNRDGIALVKTRTEAIASGEPRPGCIRLDKIACASSIASVMPIGDDYRFASLFPEPKLDVNGHDLNASRIELMDAAVSPAQKRLKFVLYPDKAGRIERVEAFLPGDPMFARTPEAYAKTKLYEAVAALTSQRACPDLTPQSSARWFENAVKPSAKFGRKQFETTVSNITASQDRTSRAKLCGRSFEFHSIQGVDPELVSLEANPSGTFGGMVMEVR